MREAHAPGEHGDNGLQVAAAFQWWPRDPHLIVVAAFQHHGGIVAESVLRRWLRMYTRPHPLGVALHHRLEVVPPSPARPAFPPCEAIVRWDVDGVGALLRRGSRPASGVWCRLGLGRRGEERVCPGEVRNPYPPLVRLVVVEPPSPHFDEVSSNGIQERRFCSRNV